MRVLSASNHCCCEWCVKVGLCCVNMGCKCTSTRSARVYVSTGTTVSSWVTTNTVGSKTVAMFEGFAVGGVWRLGAWEWRLALVGLGKVLLLGYQTSF